jgi:hypothetical protein
LFLGKNAKKKAKKNATKVVAFLGENKADVIDAVSF